MPHNRHYVLIIEDNSFEAMMLCDRVETAGAIGLIAQSFDECATIVQSAYVEMVIIDINLGGEMSGIEIVRKLQSVFAKEDFNPRLIVLTSTLLSDTEKDELVRMGVERILTKPMSHTELKAVVHSLQTNYYSA